MLIGAGGALGAMARFVLVNITKALVGAHFPYGTLLVNVLGSLCIGVMYVLITERLSLHPDWRSILMVGFLGAFTTFSTFSLEVVVLLENGQTASAFVYIMASVGVCLTVAWAAIVITRMI